MATIPKIKLPINPSFVTSIQWVLILSLFLGLIGAKLFVRQVIANRVNVDEATSFSQVGSCNSYVQQQKLTRADVLSNTNFGASVAVSEDLGVVGNPDEAINSNSRQGSIHVFLRAVGAWNLEQKIVAADGAFDDRFGSAVAIGGNTIVVGAPGDDIGASSNQGSAYVFTRSGAVWNLQQKLTAADGTFGDQFGGSVAISNDTIVIGASLDDPTNLERGSAYVFVRSGTVWSQQQKLIAADAGVADHFGGRVVLEGDTAVVSATGADIAANNDQGSVYVFVRSGASWSQQQKLTAPDGSANEFFGTAIALSGDTVAVGLSIDTIGATISQGSVYVFLRNGVTWNQQQKIVAADGSATDYFGSSVAISGDTLAIAASGDDIPPLDQGSVYLFTRSGANWSEQHQLTTADGYGFGSSSLAINNGTLVVGSPSDNFNRGAAYVFVCSPCPSITLTPTTLANNITTGVFYSQPITAIGGTGSYTFSVTIGTLPSGLMLSPLGILSGTPNTLGYVLFTIQATDSNGCSSARAYALNIVPPCGTINISPATIPDGYVGVFYVESIIAGGGQGNYTFSVAAGALPDGLTLDPGPATSASFRGTPTITGVFNFVVRATDGIGCAATRTYSITIWPPCPEIMISPTFLPNSRVGVAYNQSLGQTGGALPITWSISSGGLPTGLTLDSNTGVISGIPTTPITFPLGYAFTVRARDANQCIGLRDYNLILFPGCPAITVSPATLPNGFVNTPFNQQITASGGVAAYSYAIGSGSLPSGVTLSTDGYLSGVPSASGIFNFAIQATDNNSCTGTRSYTLNINANSGPPIPPKLVASDGLNDDQFGYSVALSGDTAICGVPLDDFGSNIDPGSAYVFVRNGLAWAQQQKLTANDAWNQDYFGTSAAISGDTAFVGAHKADIGGRNDQGAVYVFVRSGTTWVQQQKLFDTDDGVAGDNFGRSVAVNGDSLVIGATGAMGTRGVTYVYVRSGATWIKQQRLIATDGPEGNGFGFGIATAVSGNTIVIGASSSSVGTSSLQGAVYVFTRSGTIWTQQQKLIANDGADGDAFGNSVALEGDTAVIGAFRKTVGANLDQGSAYIFVRSGTAWAQQQKLAIGGGVTHDTFGASVALSNNIALIGANGTDGYQGAVYVYSRNGSSWMQQNKLTAYDGRPFHNFGNSVAMSGNLAVIGAVTSTGVGNGQPGAGYVYLPNCLAISVSPSIISVGTAGVSYNQVINASGGTAPYSFYLTAGVLPTGVTLSPSGVISGIPTVSGNFPITITAADANGCQGIGTYTLTINSSACGTLTLNPVTLANGNYSEAYPDTNFNVSGGTAPYTFSLVNGALPNGLNLLNGVLSGIPTQAGSFNFMIQSTDTNGCVVRRGYTLTINNLRLQFYPLAHPVRLLETRSGESGCIAPGVPITGNTSLAVPARGTCDGLTIPANAAAVTGNVTSVNSGGGYLTIYPSDAAQPFVSNSNYTPNQILNNVFTVGLGAADGAFKIYVVTDTDVVVDITGYYAPPGAGGLFFHPLPAPVRLLETRPGEPVGCFRPATPLLANQDFLQQGNGTCGIPGTALALVGNATTVSPLAGGYLNLFPADATRPFIASGNYLTNQILNSPFTVGLSPSGQFKVYTSAQTHLVIDVSGYYSADAADANGAGLLFSPMTPARLLDTRLGETACFTPGIPIPAGTDTPQAARGVCTIPATAQAIVGNAAVVTPGLGGFLTFWPSNATRPFVATSNYVAGEILNRHFTVGLGTDGAFKIYTSTPTHLVIDVSGSFAP